MKSRSYISQQTKWGHFPNFALLYGNHNTGNDNVHMISKKQTYLTLKNKHEREATSGTVIWELMIAIKV
jgi:hypothetical protein